MITEISHNKSNFKSPWLQHTNVNDNFELSNKYANICQQHKQEKKWVLFINPEESSIETLAKTHGIDVSKILMVNYKNTVTSKSKVELEQIKSVLSKGNCSAVILSNSLFEVDEIAQLENSAQTGETHCFLVKQCQLH
jgi:cell division inhibitor SulA